MEQIQAVLGTNDVKTLPSPLITRVCDLDAAIQMGFTVTLSDVTSEEFAALRILHEERVKPQERESRFESARAAQRQKSQGHG